MKGPFCRLLSDSDEDVIINKNNLRSARSVISNPLCGPFSGLNLGQSELTYSATTKHASYLFKPTKPLIQPARLKIDDTEWSDTARSSPTVSSGYDSVTSFLNRSPDSISEFDSVSQIARRDSKNLSNEFRWRKSRTSGNDLQSFYNDTNSPHTMVPYRKPSDDRYYGVSSRCSPNCSNSSSSSHVQVDHFCSTVQIMLFSSAFFILGFSLQTFIAKLQS